MAIPAIYIVALSSELKKKKRKRMFSLVSGENKIWNQVSDSKTCDLANEQASVSAFVNGKIDIIYLQWLSMQEINGLGDINGQNSTR